VYTEEGHIWTFVVCWCYDLINAEEGVSPFQIDQMLIALDRTLISGAKEQFKKKSDERTNWQIVILSGSLVTDLKKKEQTKLMSGFNYRTIQMLKIAEKTWKCVISWKFLQKNYKYDLWKYWICSVLESFKKSKLMSYILSDLAF
jgi:hypothetical protein